MRLNMASDYALRVLMLLSQSKQSLTVEGISEKLRIPKSHVMKIVAKLNQNGYVKSNRGRSGGISLYKNCQDIRIGNVVRLMEADFAVVECLRGEDCDCYFASGCALTPIMQGATDVFLEHLDKYTLQMVMDGMSV